MNDEDRAIVIEEVPANLFYFLPEPDRCACCRVERVPGPGPGNRCAYCAPYTDPSRSTA